MATAPKSSRNGLGLHGFLAAAIRSGTRSRSAQSGNLLRGTLNGDDGLAKASAEDPGVGTAWNFWRITEIAVCVLKSADRQANALWGAQNAVMAFRRGLCGLWMLIIRPAVLVWRDVCSGSAPVFRGFFSLRPIRAVPDEFASGSLYGR